MTQRKLVILIFTLIALWAVLSTPLQRMGKFNNYDEPPRKGELLTFDEIDEFLRLWSIYFHKDFTAGNIKQISMTEQAKASETASPKLKRWLWTQGWNVDRFFYVEDRLRSVVKTAYYRANINANKEILKQKMLAGSYFGDAANLKKIIKRQEETQTNNEKITDEEVAIVEGNLDKIINILQGTAVYRP